MYFSNEKSMMKALGIQKASNNNVDSSSEDEQFFEATDNLTGLTASKTELVETFLHWIRYLVAELTLLDASKGKGKVVESELNGNKKRIVTVQEVETTLIAIYHSLE
ncbi:hypothetical protein RIR_jg1741.t1 [Rhizophagus irregularis DAOM 181602=DAOM 197198]|nr:hypothetical protein RIR_jg1741.t1 [Rhizophagus irregularis DAOM 181602=DAOM 197198]